MHSHTREESVLNHIQELYDEEKRLLNKKDMEHDDREKLKGIEVQLDQCWDLLRQRRALRDADEDPAKAEVRSPDIVENYEQ